MLLLACGAVAADSQAPAKPDLRPVPWMHQRVQVLDGHVWLPRFTPHVMRLRVVKRIVNPSHPEPLWLSKPEVGLLGLVTYGVSALISAYVYCIVLRALLQRRHAQGHSYAETGIFMMGIMRDIVFSVCIAMGIGSAAGIASAVLVLAGRGLVVRPLPVRTSPGGSREMA